MRADAGTRVVLVEDGAADAGTARRMLATLHPAAELDLYTTGESLLEALEGRAPGTWWPRVFVVDINLAGRTGIEVLQSLKSGPWSRIPVVVLSGSTDEGEVQHCYDLGAAGYVTKPMGAGEVAATWEAITGYWLDTAVPTTPPDAP